MIIHQMRGAMKIPAAIALGLVAGLWEAVVECVTLAFQAVLFILKVVIVLYVVHLVIDLNKLAAIAGDTFRHFIAGTKAPDRSFCVGLPPERTL